MRIHLLQHGTFDDHEMIELWTDFFEYQTKKTVLINGDKLPGIDDFDWLIVLGGVMNTTDEDKYPWLVEEKKLIKAAIDRDKIVLGICLGAQLIAEVLGSKVTKNKYREIGWQPVRLTPEGKKSPVFRYFSDRFTVFQWHDFTFGIPDGAVKIAENDACPNQAFEYNGRVIGIQFHPEYSVNSIEKLINEHGDQIVEGKYIQPKEDILTEWDQIQHIDGLIDLLLTNIDDTFGS